MADILGSTSSTATLAINGLGGISSIETAGDQDWWKVSLTAGTAYTFRLDTLTFGGVGDPLLRLLDATGRQLAWNDDAGGTLNSALSFTATQSGSYFLSAQGYGSATGNYLISATTAATMPVLSIAATSASQAEGNSGSTAFTFTVTRSGSTVGSSTVNWAVAGGSASASDFTGGVLTGVTLTFAAGETSRLITINVAGDTQIEADEDFKVVLSAPTGAFTEVLPMSDPGMNPSAPSVAEITATAAREARAALAERNGQLKARCDAFLAATAAARAAEVRGCYEAALADPDQTADGFTAAVLAKLAEQPAEPIAGAYQTRATAGEDQRDKLMTACADALLARAAVRTGKPVDLNGNPFRGKTLARIAEDSLVRGGTRVDGLDPMRIVAMAFTQSTSDFPVLMENVMHKAMLAGYNVAADTWRRWCAVGSVSDFRAHNRYMLGSIGDLTDVSEGGEFQNASIPDGRKQSVTIGTKGQILTLTRQAIINDDLGAFVGLAEARGRAAARTVENAVYTAMGLNSGYGPTLSDGKTIIHSDHGNIASTGGAPSVATVESGILTMAAQKDISGNDYLDLRPSILLVPIGLDMTARVLNTSANDPAATGSSKNFLTPNPYQGYFADIVSSQRLVATKWYMLASPSVAPVLEVSFLNGVQEPVMEMETGFTVDGVSWKTRLDFGVSGVGYEGIVYNAGQ